MGQNGPVKENKFTDVFCCIFFLGYVAGMIAIVVLNLANSNIGSMREISDSEGNICGSDSGFEDYPNLMMFNFAAPYRSVCVKECPKFDYNQIKYNADGTNSSVIEPVYFENFTKAVEYEWRLNGGEGTYEGGHADGTDGSSASSGDKPFAFDAEFAKGYYTEDQWNTYVGNFQLECKTNADVASCANNVGKENFLYDSRAYFGNSCFPLAPKVAKYGSALGDMSSSAEDLRIALWAIVGSIVAALVISLLILLVTRIFMGCTIWTLISIFILSCFLLSFAAFFLLYLSGQAGAYEKWIEKLGPNQASQLKKITQSKKIILGIAIVSLLAGIGMLVYVCKKRKSISVATGVLEVAAKFVFRYPVLFIIMLLCFFLQLGTFLACAFGILSVHTSGTSVRDPVRGGPFPTFEYDIWKWAEMIYMGLGTYWTLAFWNNLCDFTVAGAAVNAYFGKTDSVVGGPFCGGLIYHLGSIAYGSLILGPCSLFRIVFGWFQALARDDKPNAIQKLMGKLCCCCLWPYEKWCMRVDDNAFAMIWLTKLNLCPAGKKDFYLSRRVGEKVGNAKWIGMFYSICARFSIVALTTYVSWLCFTKWEYFNTKLQNPMIPTFAVFFIGLIISTLVMNLFSTACEANLMCYLTQLDCDVKPTHGELDETIARTRTSDKDGNRYHELQ